MFEEVKKVIVGGAAILALLPTAALVSGLITFPEDFDRFLKLTVGVTGPITLFIVFALRSVLMHRGLPVRIALIGASLAAGGWCLLETRDYATMQIVEIDERVGDTEEVRVQRYVKPEALSVPLDRIVNGEFRGNWRYAIVDEHHGPSVRGMMREQSLPVQRRITLMVNLAQSLLIFAFLVAAFSAVEAPSRQRVEPDTDGNG